MLIMVSAFITIACLAAGVAVALAAIGWRWARSGSDRAAIGVSALLSLSIAVSFASLSALLFPLINGILGPSGAQSIPCDQAVQVVDQTALPAGATSAHCTHTGFQDHLYVISFVADRALVDQWLDGFPGAPTLSSASCITEAQLCTGPIEFGLGSAVDTARVEANATPEGRLAVTLSAFET